MGPMRVGRVDGAGPRELIHGGRSEGDRSKEVERKRLIWIGWSMGPIRANGAKGADLWGTIQGG